LPGKDAPPVRNAARAAGSGARGFALRFIGGKYQGGEFPLLDNREVIVGRGSNLDMVLVEDMVSRRHAKITVSGDEVTIQDLGSTNGTFVNGERIKSARLVEGDRILIGTSILTLVSANGGATEVESKDLSEISAERRTSQVRTMSGTIEEVPLPDLLQLFSTNKKSGVVVVKSDPHVGRIYLRKGQIFYATIDERTDVAPLKSLYRMLGWERGAFDLTPPDERTFADEIQLGTEAMLMEGMRQLDEMRRYQLVISQPDTRLSIAGPLVPPLRDLQPKELDVLQLVWNYGQVDTVLDRSAATDAETTAILVRLIEKDYLRID
jgi:pSer/pThr/pTyr-binding forkhead associated (FHA) protein